MEKIWAISLTYLFQPESMMSLLAFLLLIISCPSASSCGVKTNFFSFFFRFRDFFGSFSSSLLLLSSEDSLASTSFLVASFSVSGSSSSSDSSLKISNTFCKIWNVRKNKVKGWFLQLTYHGRKMEIHTRNFHERL